MKAKWLGLDKLQHWDRNAPLPGDDDRAIRWDEARNRVLTAYGAFSPELAAVGRQFFDKPWIDAGLRPGKSGGAFAHPTVPSAHPYLLLNYHGRTRDVMTLAHELGHGVHQVLAAPQGYLQSGTPLTLAETASVFGEMLTFRALLDAETDPARRRIMLACKVEDMLNTVVRQTAFYQFETLLHDERRGGELLPERIGAIWRQVQTESLGPAFEFTPDYDVFWAYVPHFVHSPFYVYAYAFGDCLVNALYGVFQDGHPGFQAKYLDMLRAGGTKRHKELLAPFGLDASDPAFWRRGLDVIAGFIDELEGFRHVNEDGEPLRRDQAAWPARRAPSGGIAARVAGPARVRHQDRQGGACGGSEGHPGWAEGSADEGGADPVHHPGRPAGGVRGRAGAVAGQRAPDGLDFVRRRMAGELGPDWQSKFSRSARRPPRRPAWARCTAPPCRTGGGGVQAAISGHGQHGGGRSAAASPRDVGLQADRAGHPARRHLHRTGRAPAGGTGLPARGRADAALRI